MLKKWYPFLGMLAPLVYAFAVILGGIIMPEYTHIYNTISELTGTGFPDFLILDILFIVYNLLLIAFSLGGLIFFQPGKLRLARILFSLLLAAGVIGLLLSFFPQDMRGAAPTFSGTTHIILAAIISPVTVACAVIAGFTFRSDPVYHHISGTSLIMAVVILVTGGATAASIAADSPIGGVFERLTIGAFLVWLFLLAASIRKQQGQDDA